MAAAAGAKRAACPPVRPAAPRSGLFSVPPAQLPTSRQGSTRAESGAITIAPKSVAVLTALSPRGAGGARRLLPERAPPPAARAPTANVPNGHRPPSANDRRSPDQGHPAAVRRGAAAGGPSPECPRSRPRPACPTRALRSREPGPAAQPPSPPYRGSDAPPGPSRASPAGDSGQDPENLPRSLFPGPSARQVTPHQSAQQKL